MTWVAVAIAGSAILGAAVSSSASRRASNTQADAAQDATEAQMQMFREGEANLAPWRAGGQNALQILMRQLGIGGTAQNPTFDPNAPFVRPFGLQDITADPGYQFALQQGKNALLNKASAGGGVYGGNTARSIADYVTGLAGQQAQNAFLRYNTGQTNAYNRIAGLSDTGVNAAGRIAGLGANAATQAGENTMGAANALAAGQLASAQAWNSGLNNATQNWLMAQYLQRPQTTQPAPTSAAIAADPYYAYSMGAGWG